MRVLGGTGIGLQLSVSPASPAEIICPLRWIGLRVRGAIELVAPDESQGSLCKGGRKDTDSQDRTAYIAKAHHTPLSFVTLLHIAVMRARRRASPKSWPASAA